MEINVVMIVGGEIIITGNVIEKGTLMFVCLCVDTQCLVLLMIFSFICGSYFKLLKFDFDAMCLMSRMENNASSPRT